MTVVDPDLASRFAARAHAHQRYGDRPYTVHLAETVGILGEVGVTDPVLLAAAWLHDVVEDTDVDAEQVEARFGPRVAALVTAVTDDDGATRAERKAGAYRRIASTEGAVLVKLADRLANVRACLREVSEVSVRSPRGQRKLDMYRTEHPGLRAAVRSLAPGPTEQRLWSMLDAALDL